MTNKLNWFAPNKIPVAQFVKFLGLNNRSKVQFWQVGSGAVDGGNVDSRGLKLSEVELSNMMGKGEVQ